MRLHNNITCDHHSHTIIHVLNGLHHCVYNRCIGNGFHEGIVVPLAVDYLDPFKVPMADVCSECEGAAICWGRY